jgi:hypothetical protein
MKNNKSKTEQNKKQQQQPQEKEWPQRSKCPDYLRQNELAKIQKRVNVTFRVYLPSCLLLAPLGQKRVGGSTRGTLTQNGFVYIFQKWLNSLMHFFDHPCVEITERNF